MELGPMEDDDERNLLLNWTDLYQEKMRMMDDHELTMELKRRDEEILHLKHLLKAAIKERDEAQQRCHALSMEKLLLQQQPTPHSSIENTSDCDESIVSSPPVLPEKGKLLQAVIKAGPLLQTLLLAGPLPQWRHPPPACQIPPPPVVVPPPSLHQCGRRKRGLPLPECSDSTIDEFKYQRLVLQ